MPRRGFGPAASGGRPSGRAGRGVTVGFTLARMAGFSWDALVELVRTADRLGSEALWTAEAYSWEAFSQLGWFAAVTQRIRLATGVVNVFSRSPACSPSRRRRSTASAEGASCWASARPGPGRAWLARGPFERALGRLRETAEIIHTVLLRQRLVYDGQVFELDGGIKLACEPGRSRVPIYLATLTPEG